MMKPIDLPPLVMNSLLFSVTDYVAHTLKLGEDCPTAIGGFHAQQCVEKNLKAYLVLKLLDLRTLG
jgi:HEPN domain-containing protein